MNKFFVTMCVTLLCMSIQAQELKHEIGVFYGLIPQGEKL